MWFVCLISLSVTLWLNFSRINAWQIVFLWTYFGYLILDICLFQTIGSIVLNIGLPWLVYNRVTGAHYVLDQCIQYCTHQWNLQNLVLNAPKYFFVSDGIADIFPNLVESALVKAYTNPYLEQNSFPWMHVDHPNISPKEILNYMWCCWQSWIWSMDRKIAAVPFVVLDFCIRILVVSLLFLMVYFSTRQATWVLMLILTIVFGSMVTLAVVVHRFNDRLTQLCLIVKNYTAKYWRRKIAPGEENGGDVSSDGHDVLGNVEDRVGSIDDDDDDDDNDIEYSEEDDSDSSVLFWKEFNEVLASGQLLKKSVESNDDKSSLTRKAAVLTERNAPSPPLPSPISHPFQNDNDSYVGLCKESNDEDLRGKRKRGDDSRKHTLRADEDSSGDDDIFGEPSYDFSQRVRVLVQSITSASSFFDDDSSDGDSDSKDDSVNDGESSGNDENYLLAKTSDAIKSMKSDEDRIIRLAHSRSRESSLSAHKQPLDDGESSSDDDMPQISNKNFSERVQALVQGLYTYHSSDDSDSVDDV